MERFNVFIKKYFYLSLIFFALGLFFGLLYSINLLGVNFHSDILSPVNTRSVHISLMLYGFIPLMLSYLPFLIINKDIGYDEKAVRYLEIYTVFWFVFLVYMVISLLLGVSRGLVFYDFHYSLNFILFLSGIFYALALYRYIRLYRVIPLWIKVCLYVVVAAPFVLVVLMNPEIGQVEATVTGPHGDNTLGMSLALIPIYYLIIKYLSRDDFKARWNIFWMIPLFFYILSVLHRTFVGELTYAQEWFFQWLTFLYIPLLYRWYRDADIKSGSKLLLLISILAFLFVDVEGNILFIESIRWVFHRNDLIVAHAHIAMGVGVLFMTLALYGDIIKQLQERFFKLAYLVAMGVILVSLSLSGFVQGGFINLDIGTLWGIRTAAGVLAISSLLVFIKVGVNYTGIEKYNLFGFLSDGLGGIMLFLFAGFIYPIIGFTFHGEYEYVVFGFVSMTGVIHFMALRYKEYQKTLTFLTAFIRVFISGIFLSLFLSEKLGIEALLIAVYDFIFMAVYFIWFHNNWLEGEKNE